MSEMRFSPDPQTFTENTFGFVPLPPIEQVDEGNSITFNPYSKNKKSQRKIEKYQKQIQNPFIFEKIENRSEFQAQLKQKLKQMRKESILYKNRAHELTANSSESRAEQAGFSGKLSLSLSQQAPGSIPPLFQKGNIKIIGHRELQFSYDPSKMQKKSIRQRRTLKTHKEEEHSQQKLDSFINKSNV